MLRRIVVLLSVGFVVLSMNTPVTAEEAPASATQEEWNPPSAVSYTHLTLPTNREV